jgi:hypothetical protein
MPVNGGNVILYLSFEELTALNSSAAEVLAEEAAGTHAISAPPQVLTEIELLVPLLDGDLNLRSLDEQRRVERAVRHLTLFARRQMENAVLEQHPAAESAVAAYFDYAHLLAVGQRLDALGEEMAALVRLLTQYHPESEAGRRFAFPE